LKFLDRNLNNTPRRDRRIEFFFVFFRLDRFSVRQTNDDLFQIRVGLVPAAIPDIEIELGLFSVLNRSGIPDGAADFDIRALRFQVLGLEGDLDDASPGDIGIERSRLGVFECRFVAETDSHILDIGVIPVSAAENDVIIQALALLEVDHDRILDGAADLDPFDLSALPFERNLDHASREDYEAGEKTFRGGNPVGVVYDDSLAVGVLVVAAAKGEIIGQAFAVTELEDPRIPDGAPDFDRARIIGNDDPVSLFEGEIEIPAGIVHRLFEIDGDFFARSRASQGEDVFAAIKDSSFG